MAGNVQRWRKMISLVLCNHISTELRAMEEYSHYLAGRLSEEEWQFYLFENGEEMCSFLEKKPIFDIMCMDLEIPGAIGELEKLRSLNPHAHIILVATTDISPMSYMRPGIMAGSLLLRNYTPQQLHTVFEEAFRTYLKKFESDEEKEEVYVVDTREGRQLIPYSRIYYFEAREKKIVVGCVSSEVVCYDTIAGLEERLPEYFVRCHRSFIINRKKAVKLILTQNMILLEDNIRIPVSRSYRMALKEVFAGKAEGGRL